MTTRNKSLIIFSPAFAASEADTIWLPWLQVFVKALNKNYPQLSVTIFALQYPHAGKPCTWHNNQVIPMNGVKKGKVKRLFMWLRMLHSVKKFKQKNDVLGIFSMWCTECTLIAKFASTLFHLKYFCWIVGQDARRSNKYVKRIQPKPSSLIAMSDFLADEFYRNHNIRPQHIITNGLNTTLFAPTSFNKDIDIIGVGSLSILKQYDVFVRVIASLKKEIPNIKAMLCGDGEDRQHIETLINEFSIQGNIELKGIVQHTEGLQLMQRAKILLHPSSYEGFSGVCLEALYAGAHVISFTRAMHQTINHWHIVKTTEEMYAKALKLLTSPDTNYDPVLVYTMDNSAEEIMQLFGYTQ